MRSWLTLICTMMIALMIWTGTTAHAAEAMGCIEISTEAAGHFDGDSDQVPADPEKGVPHHHGGCHGHHVGIDAGAVAPKAALAESGALDLRREGLASGCDPGTALRPPIA